MKTKGLVVNKVYEIKPTKWSWRSMSFVTPPKRELKSGDTVSKENSISARSDFVQTEEGAKAAEESSQQSGVGYKVTANYETEKGSQSYSTPILMGGAEVYHVGPSTATRGHPNFVNLIDGSRENLPPGSEINISFDHQSGTTFEEMTLYVE